MVNDNIKIAAIGGDRRQLYAVLRLAEEGYRVSVTGLDTDILPTAKKQKLKKAENVHEALYDASVIVLPFPASADGIRVNAPLDRGGELGDFKLNTLLRLAEPSALIVGGKLPEIFTQTAQDKGYRICDLLKIETLEIKNAHITAEAAVSVAMNSLSRTIFGSHIAITGFGRISKQLSRLLYSLGAHVTVAARKDSDLAFAETLGYSTVKIEGEGWSCPLRDGYDMIFNTVPQRIFGRDFLERINRSTLLVELASVPGGFDISAAQELGVNISWALSLPGKYAPESAGDLIANSIKKIIYEEVRQL